MRNFFTSMLGALVALVIFTVGGALLFIGILGAIASMTEKTVAVENGSYLVLDLASSINDAPPVFDFRALGGDRTPTLQLRTITRSLRAAAEDSRIAGVFIKGDEPMGYDSGLGALREVRTALAQFRASGKPVRAYLTFATTKNYYLASVADEVIVDPYGVIFMPGLSSTPVFLAGAFEKYGVGVQVTRVGKYKSFVEPFVRKDMSPENREQMNKLLGDLWGGLINDIAASRRVRAASIQEVVDREGLLRPEVAKAAKLIDRIAYRDEVIEQMRKATGVSDAKESFKQISFSDYAKVAKDVPIPSRRPSGVTVTDRPAEPAAREAAAAADAKPESKEPTRAGRIAIVYAEGDIVDGEGDEQGEIGGTRFARELRRFRLDDDVKAVVLRVNSPGGSASGSEAIQREIRLTRQVKPVIVSMGSFAASGGYWIATYGNRIFAEPTTITGSIGIFGIMFDVQRLFGNFGVTFDNVKTGKFADAFTVARPKTPEELAVLQRFVDWGYDQFITKVAESRKLKREFVEEIAQGRVWSGTEARKLGLVDEIGGLDSAIRHAADTAGLGNRYKLVEYPRKKEFAEALQEVVEKMAPSSARATGVSGQIAARVQREIKFLRSFDDPQGLYARLPIDLVFE